MKKYLIIFLILLIIGIVAAIVFLDRNRGEVADIDRDNFFPVDTSPRDVPDDVEASDDVYILPSLTRSRIVNHPEVRMLDDGGFFADLGSAGATYLISDGPDNAIEPPYTITFSDVDGSYYFNIALFDAEQAPGTLRRQAETDLMRILNLGQDGMCQLNYGVFVLPGFDDRFVGKDLRFSFCEGNTALPEVN